MVESIDLLNRHIFLLKYIMGSNPILSINILIKFKYCIFIHIYYKICLLIHVFKMFIVVKFLKKGYEKNI